MEVIGLEELDQILIKKINLVILLLDLNMNMIIYLLKKILIMKKINLFKKKEMKKKELRQ